jgi:hypothetical protein
MGMRGSVGVITQIPATVEQAGQALVPVEPLTEYVETLSPGANVTLSQQKDASLPTARQNEGTPLLAAKKASCPLDMESAAMGVTSHAQLTCWTDDHYPMPPVQEWLASGVAIATIPASMFKKAVTDCAPCANMDIWSKDDTAEMYGILMQVQEGFIELSATTGTMLVCHRIPLENPTPRSFTGLFLGKSLSWIRDALAHDNGNITVILTQDAQTAQSVLLLSMREETWFCRSMDLPSPTSWARTLGLPHETEFLISRGDLRAPLAFYAETEEASKGLVLRIEGTTLTLSAIASSDELVQREQQLPLVASSADLTLLVNPKQFQRLARQVSGELLQLEVGHFERQEQHETRQIGFLRASSEHVRVMMSLSRTQERWVSLSPQDSSSVREPVSTPQA